MTNDRRLVPSPSSSSTSAVGLCLLPSELLLEIFLQLALPELIRLRSVSRLLGSLVSGDDFRRLYDLRSGRGGGWLFVYKKRPPRYSVLRGFNDRTGRWFQISLAGILSPVVPPTEDLYFLAASGGFFLFASNTRRELVAVSLATGAVRRLPTSPLGPRGTSSWRRSSLKLVADPSGSDRFRFLFSDMFQSRPALFEYDSETDAWRVIEAQETAASQPPDAVDDGRICLIVSQYGSESLVLSFVGGGGSSEAAPRVHRPRFPQGLDGGPLVGFATNDRFHVYGDGYVAVIRSTATTEEGGGGGGRGTSRTRAIASVELLAMSGEGNGWELVSRAPEAVVAAVRRPYGVMMGCLVEREGTVRMVLMSNCRGTWGLAWLAYHHRSGGTQRGTWTWVPVPDCGTKGLNMAGLAISSTFSRLWHASARDKSS